MIKRIVKLTIKEDEIQTFKALFSESKSTILSFKCLYVECLQVQSDPSIFFTYSHWESEDALNEYRYSDEFASIWSKTKVLFAAKAEAWSTQELAKDQLEQDI